MQILGYALDLRRRRQFDDANRLEELLENLVDLTNDGVNNERKGREQLSD